MRNQLGVADCHASGYVAAKVTYERDADELRFCMHCAERHHDALTAAGWVRAAANIRDHAAQVEVPA